MHVPPRDRQVLQSWAHGASVRAGLAQRARIVLLAADGTRTSEIVARTGASKPTVSAWKKRYAVEGLAGLQDRRKPGRPRRTGDAAIVLATLEPPPERLAVKRWSSRLLASELGVSNVKVAETWREYGLQPWRREPFRFSTDPHLEVKSRTVTGLYLNPPDHAVVLSTADERTRVGIQGLLNALDPVARPVGGSPLGGSTVASSTVVGSTALTTAYYPRRRHRAYLHFLQEAADACASADLHVVVVDSYATRRHPEVRAWLARHPRIMPHLTPTQRTWLTMTEIFAGLSTGTGATPSSDTGLSAAITTVTDSWTEGSQPFAWTRSPDEYCDAPPPRDEASLASPAELP